MRPDPAPARPAAESIWTDPGPVERLDFGGGPGGRQGAPKAPFKFIEEDKGGTNPKIKVSDANGREWGVKGGEEVNAEVFASRIAWAAGYYVEPSYFVKSGKIDGVTGLSRAKKYVAPDGSFADARFELKQGGITKLKDRESWHWDQNPFVNTKELAGLKIVLMLVSNWDSKDQRDGGRGSNTAIFKYERTGEVHYIFGDWGGSMGKWGGVFGRSKWDCKGFTSQTKDFIKGVSGNNVEFGYSGQRTDSVRTGITVADVQWAWSRLGKITDDQLRDALEACGADALVLSGGFVSRAPMHVMRGAMPTRVMGGLLDDLLLAAGLRLAGQHLIKPVPYEENYFLEDATRVRAAVRLPLIYIGGAVSREGIDRVLARGFDAVAMARALIREPDFVNRLRREEADRSPCDHCNYCAARIYSTSMACHHREPPPPRVARFVDENGAR